jgi:uncharacterized protein with HEPN domain
VRDPYERLRDVQEAIAHIYKYTNQGKELFYQNELVQNWVIRHLEIVGEAVRSIPQDFRDLHPEIPWKQINAMRNILVHVYFDINLDRIWAVVDEDLPTLKAQVDAILDEQERNTSSS